MGQKLADCVARFLAYRVVSPLAYCVDRALAYCGGFLCKNMNIKKFYWGWDRRRVACEGGVFRGDSTQAGHTYSIDRTGCIVLRYTILSRLTRGAISYAEPSLDNAQV